MSNPISHAVENIGDLIEGGYETIKDAVAAVGLREKNEKILLTEENVSHLDKHLKEFSTKAVTALKENLEGHDVDENAKNFTNIILAFLKDKPLDRLLEDYQENINLQNAIKNLYNQREILSALNHPTYYKEIREEVRHIYKEKVESFLNAKLNIAVINITQEHLFNPRSKLGEFTDENRREVLTLKSENSVIANKFKSTHCWNKVNRTTAYKKTRFLSTAAFEASAITAGVTAVCGVIAGISLITGAFPLAAVAAVGAAVSAVATYGFFSKNQEITKSLKEHREKIKPNTSSQETDDSSINYFQRSP